MGSDDYEWARELAAQVKARKESIRQRSDRARLRRRLAATEGPILWSRLTAELNDAVDEFNKAMTPEDRITTDSTSNSYFLYTDTHTIEITSIFDEHASYIEYALDTTAPIQRAIPKKTRRIQFGLTEDDQLVFVLDRQTDAEPVSVYELARILLTSLFPWANSNQDESNGPATRR